MSSNGNPPDLERELRQVLLGLALTTNGAVTRMDADRGGGSARHHSSHVPSLRRGDAPHELYAELYRLAVTDEDRERVLRDARDELDHIRKSRAHRPKPETREQLAARIIASGAGWSARDVAIAMRTSETVVLRARRDAGRDEDLGHPVVNGRELPADRRAERIHELADRGLDARAIARAMSCSYSTVRRALGRM